MDDYCVDCKRMTEVVVDYCHGDSVCTECGLVTSSHCVDDRPEWRYFGADGDGADPNRVGAAANPLLEDGPLQTIVKPSKGASRSDLPASRLGDPTTSFRNLTRGFAGIDDMCERLILPDMIKFRASEIFKAVEDKKASCRRFNNRQALLAASLYIACKQEGKNHTLKEICSVSNGLKMSDIGRAEKFIAKHVPEMMDIGAAAGAGTVQSGCAMMKRFGYQLGLTYPAIKAAQETVGKSNELLDIRRNPVSIAAAVIYMVSQLSDDKKSLQDVSVATGVAQGTIRDSYKDLHPHLSKIVPSWFTQTCQSIVT